jgi:hypothetical protein
VELDRSAVRFELREKSGKLNALTLRCEEESTAQLLKDRLPSERTADYRRKMPEHSQEQPLSLVQLDGRGGKSGKRSGLLVLLFNTFT